MSEALVEVRAFAKSFGPKVVHRKTDFVLGANEVVGLIGGSGTGKSVLLRAMIGLEQADSGQILYKGQDITNLAEDEWIPIRRQIAYAFQFGALFDSLTVEENLLYPLDAHTKLSRAEKQKKVDDILELLGLKGCNKLMPVDLSGGMQKRAGLARAMILDPEVILYDEPTAGLDPFNTRNIQEMINALKHRGKGGVLVTHDMATAFATCERICLLHEGHIAVSGRTEDLKNDPLVHAFVNGELKYGKA